MVGEGAHHILTFCTKLYTAIAQHVIIQHNATGRIRRISGYSLPLVVDSIASGLKWVEVIESKVRKHPEA